MRGQGSVSFEHREQCRDAKHKSCVGRWAGTVYVKGTRYRATGRTKTEVGQKLNAKRKTVEAGLDPRRYTVGQCIDDWLDGAFGGRSPKTVITARSVTLELRPLLADILLTDLTGVQVSGAMRTYAKTHSSSTTTRALGQLRRAIRFAAAQNRVARNVADLVDAPAGGLDGRPSKSMTQQQMLDVIKGLQGTGVEAYVILSLVTGVRTEEARALCWSDVDLSGDFPGISVVRAVRHKGDTKTRTSRRSLDLADVAVGALQRHRSRQAADRLAAGTSWHDSDLVFCNQLGQPLTNNKVRKMFKRALEGIEGIDPDEWTPRELRHTFVSVMSYSGVPNEEIARLVGHTRTATTESVYRHELKPRHQAGAEAMNRIVNG